MLKVEHRTLNPFRQTWPFFSLASLLPSPFQKRSIQMTSQSTERGLFIRAVAAFLALPGVVAFLIPLLMVDFTEPGGGAIWLGVILLGVGVTILFWCAQVFYREGQGTLAPWSPPRHLVTSGLYQYSRNPMYVGVVLILAGWALLYASVSLLVYAVFVLAAFHLRIVLGEEHWLEHTHKEAWKVYVSQVRRWFGRN
jgi:protein-S-isoprenylcysteine O-methyltransferase Ste14